MHAPFRPNGNMSDDLDIDLPSLTRAKLRSERIRILCMVGLFAAFSLLGLFRVFVPLNGARTVGYVVFGTSSLYLALELLMFLAVAHQLKTQGPLNRWLSLAHGASECLYPIITIYFLMLLVPQERYTLLVSPGYGFLLVLIAISVLRADWQATALTGAVATLGYGGLVAFGLLGREADAVNPHPPSMYVNLTLMLGIATAASAFVANQVRAYVLAAVREMEIRKQRDRLKHDLEVAQRIQESLLPGSMPDFAGYQFAAVSRPADETGGDYYDWQAFSPQRAVFSLGDVTGHGIGPALVTAACRAYVRAILSKESPPAAVLRLVNTLLLADLPDGRFVTLALVDLNAETHEVRLLSAGHGPTLVVRNCDGDVRKFDSQGLPLGLYEDGMLEDAVQFSLARGDLVVLCSDGFFEPANSAGEEYGVERLADVLRSNRHESAPRLVELMENQVREFVGDMPQPDDMTALVIKRCK